MNYNVTLVNTANMQSVVPVVANDAMGAVKLVMEMLTAQGINLDTIKSCDAIPA